MQVKKLGLCDLRLVTCPTHQDPRGWFAETFNGQVFSQAGLPTQWAQDNQSSSRHGVLRGLHFQTRKPQGKLIRVLSGAIWDVAVDLRRDSPDFGRWLGIELEARTPESQIEMLWIPPGFAHGFLVLSEVAEVLYKVTEPYDPGGEQTLAWNDSTVGVQWPLERLQIPEPVVSPKDSAGLALNQLTLF